MSGRYVDKNVSEKRPFRKRRPRVHCQRPSRLRWWRPDHIRTRWRWKIQICSRARNFCYPCYSCYFLDKNGRPAGSQYSRRSKLGSLWTAIRISSFNRNAQEDILITKINSFSEHQKGEIKLFEFKPETGSVETFGTITLPEWGMPRYSEPGHFGPLVIHYYLVKPNAPINDPIYQNALRCRPYFPPPRRFTSKTISWILYPSYKLPRVTLSISANQRFVTKKAWFLWWNGRHILQILRVSLAV